MQDTLKTQVTKLSIREDQAAATASSFHGANLDVIAFNITFLGRHDPKLAQEVLALLHRAGDVEATVPGTTRSLVAHRAK